MTDLLSEVAMVSAALADVYRDLHRHPELSFAEHRTSNVIIEHLSALGIETLTGLGGTGVVGVVRNGAGPTVMLRADMDALPVLEETGLDYASTDRGPDPDGRDVPIMHACGHDMHVTCLLGATSILARNTNAWSGTLVVVFQPGEEVGSGATAMIDDGLFDRVPAPAVVLGQHVAPAPAGMLGAHPGPAFAGSDGLTVRLFGRGGHGSRPETTVDPVVMAAATVMRLQTVASREVAAAETAVVTVGQLHAGSKSNIIPEEATLGISVRTTDAAVRERVLGAVHRIIRAEAAASGAPREPEIVPRESFPPLINDPDATRRVTDAFRSAFGAENILEPGAVTGSEDVSFLATASGAPLVFWLLGGTDAAQIASAVSKGTMERDIPSNHSSHFAPVIHPTLDRGIAALIVAAIQWLRADEGIVPRD
jgi:amidohydrolase